MTAPRLEAHPAAQLFPLLEGEDLAALVADIKDHGLRVPIVLHEGKILDGRNRYQACRLAGVEPRTEEWRGKGDPAEWVASINLHRRHLSESQRAMVGARLRAYHEEQARAREHARKTGTSANLRESSAGKSSEKAASTVNVSARSVDAAVAVLQRAAPELVKAVESGKVAVSAAADLLDLPRREQAAIVRQVESGEAKSVRAAIRERQAPLTDDERLVRYLQQLSSSLPGIAATASSAADLIEELGISLSGAEAANAFLKVEAAKNELTRLYKLSTNR